jgi:CubicO group peptidase (beta-lactamase class C family)
MHHTAGYRDYYPLDFVDRRMLKPTAVDDVLRDYAAGKLDFEPRTRFSYSNTGYLILGRVVEKVSGEPFGRFLQKRVLEPLGMKDTAFEPNDGGEHTAQGYRSFALAPPEKAPREAAEWIHAAGAMYSTPGDLLKWDLALMEGKLLRPESYWLMTTPARLADGKSTGYGCGLGVSERQRRRVLSHSGAVGGFAAFNTLIPGTKSAVVLLANCEE